MLLRVGPCLRVSAAKLLFAVSSFFIITIIVFYLCYFGPVNSVSAVLDPAVRQNSAPTDREKIPPLPSACPESRPGTPLDPQSPTLAPALRPEDLLCRQINATTGIPKIFHQSWKTTKLPSKFSQWSETCRRMHPDWEWVLWTDDDNHKLVKTYFPWLEETYLGLPGPIYRADFARNLYMYMFGGYVCSDIQGLLRVYADLDLECLRPTAEALEPYRIRVVNTTDTATDHRPLAVFGRLGSDESFEHSIPNAWMASTPRHPFFLLPLKSTQAEVKKSKTYPHKLWYFFPSAEHLTGPIALRRSILRWKSSLEDMWSEIVLLPSELIYPFSWKTPGLSGWVCSTLSDRFDEDKCKERLELDKKGSLTLTFWSHTHDGAASSEKNIASVSRDKQ